jgi:hypothetical protein
MPKQAPRIDPRLVAAVGQFDDGSEPIAATNRRVGRVAEQLGIVRPSYEQVRVLVHSERCRIEEGKAKRALVESVLRGRRSPSALESLCD